MSKYIPESEDSQMNSSKRKFLDELRTLIIVAGGSTPSFEDLQSQPLGQALDNLLPNGIGFRAYATDALVEGFRRNFSR